MSIGFLFLATCMVSQASKASRPPEIRINQDESKVPPYTLPDPLRKLDGRAVESKSEWPARREELMRLFEVEVYGKTPSPPRPLTARFHERSRDETAVGGKAIRREITIELGGAADGPRIDMLLYTPKKATPAPILLAYNFWGNQTIDPDPAIIPTRLEPRPPHSNKDEPNRRQRGSDHASWPLERILDRGYGLATACYSDVDPDYDDGFVNGIHPLFYQPGQTHPADDEWGSIGAWAWGLSRMLDYLETAPGVDARRVVVMGHSRLGKTALWAGARDERFAIVVSLQSGCGGAALSKRDFGENVARINTSFPHWFCKNFRKYNNNESALPLDQHELIALVAPRPVLICSAAEDLWADPKGEFLGALGADPVYRLLGTDGLATKEMPAPAPDQLIKSTIGYHIRPGGHSVTGDDWDAVMTFADRHLPPATISK